jgi:hypothetical protein
LSIEDIKEALDIVDLDTRPTTHLRRHDAKRVVIGGPREATADGGIHDIAVRSRRAMGFPGKHGDDVIIQREGGPV